MHLLICSEAQKSLTNLELLSCYNAMEKQTSTLASKMEFVFLNIKTLQFLKFQKDFHR